MSSSEFNSIIYPKILFEKDCFCMVKENISCFKVSFAIQNTKIYLEKIIDIDLIKLVYDLNPDIFESIEFKKNENNPNEATVYFIMKHFFEDLGMPQFYNHIYVTRITNNEYINFKMEPIINKNNHNIEKTGLVQMPLEKMDVICYKISPHKIKFQYNILFNKTREIPPYIEKLVGNVVYKIFNKVKLFIENVIV